MLFNFGAIRNFIRLSVDEFQQFALRGNPIQVAIGVVIGNAFGKVITSFVSDVAMPPLSLILGLFTFTDLKITLLEAKFDYLGHIIRNAVEIRVGGFLQALIDFLIVAFCVFVAIKGTNSLYYRLEHKILLPDIDGDDKQTVLLSQIKDLLEQQSKKN